MTRGENPRPELIDKRTNAAGNLSLNAMADITDFCRQHIKNHFKEPYTPEMARLIIDHGFAGARELLYGIKPPRRAPQMPSQQAHQVDLLQQLLGVQTHILEVLTSIKARLTGVTVPAPTPVTVPVTVTGTEGETGTESETVTKRTEPPKRRARGLGKARVLGLITEWCRANDTNVITKKRIDTLTGAVERVDQTTNGSYLNELKKEGQMGNGAQRGEWVLLQGV